MNNKPKAIFFDWFGALCHCEILKQLSNKNHPMHIHQKTVRDFLYMNKRSITQELMLGNMTMRDYSDEIARRIGVPGHEILNEFAISFSNLEWADPLFPTFLEKMRKNGIKTVLMANVSHGFKKYTVPALELNKYFDAILLSCDLKCLKYDTSLEDLLFFERFLKDNKINYNECLVLDDNPEKKILKIMEIPYEITTDVGSIKSIMKKYI